ncbi:hypothetical protein V2T44_14600 [Serratia ficaria]|nr:MULTISPECIES: hypothetical protein [Serratia]MEE4484171.1 hypothetical protein [Serratia ficaria]
MSPMMITCLVGKTPRLIDKTIWHLFSFGQEAMINGGEQAEFLLLSIVIRLLYFYFGNNPGLRRRGEKPLSPRQEA